MAIRIEVPCAKCGATIEAIVGLPEEGVELDELPMVCRACGEPLVIPGISGDDEMEPPTSGETITITLVEIRGR